MRKLLIALFSILILVSLLLLPGVFNRRQGNRGEVQSQLVAQAAEDLSGFARASGPMPLSFPADFGPHPDYQTEWWYYTGNLDGPDSRHFGYQLTFFRRALLPPDQIQPRLSDWTASQIYMAHFALTDVQGERYQAFERTSRAAAGLAGAQAEPYHVWLEDWAVEQVEPGVVHMQASQDGLALDLRLADAKGPILQGDQGYSRKGPQPGQASYYYSQTHLVTSGTVRIGGDSYLVNGLSWMDHEFSTSYLSKDQVGWDWFAIQLNDGSELMVFQLRKADGSVDPFSSGTLIPPDGETRQLKREDFQINVEATWKSPHSKAVYPSRWKLSIPSLDLELQIDPYLADQELNVSYAYWEGAVHIQGTHSGQPVSGSGYVELTGYARSMGGQF